MLELGVAIGVAGTFARLAIGLQTEINPSSRIRMF
jgi:alkylhydroperoxidase family enzyme